MRIPINHAVIALTRQELSPHVLRSCGGRSHGDLVRASQCFVGLGPRCAGLTRDLKTSQRLAVRSSTTFTFAPCASSAATSDTSARNCTAAARRLVTASGRDFAPSLAAVEVFPHFEQLVKITATEGLPDRPGASMKSSYRDAIDGSGEGGRCRQDLLSAPRAGLPQPAEW